MAQQIQDVAYGLSQALIGVNPAPIIGIRNPKTNDKAQIGQIWINKSTGIVFFLSRIANKVYTWVQAAQAAASYTAAGAITAGTGFIATTGGLTVIDGGITVTDGGLIVSLGGANITGNTTIAGTFGVVGNSTITGTLDIGGNTSVTGDFVVTGTILTGSDITTVNGNITANTGDIIASLGNISTVAGSIISGASVFAATNIVATSGNIVALAGDVVVDAAGSGLELPGPVRIITGAGAPNIGLAVNVGDMYINTTAVTATTRLYICTANGVWTYIEANA